MVLAQLFAEHRRPPERLWEESLVSSRLLEYELWTRAHARGIASEAAEGIRSIVNRLALLELLPNILSQAPEPFPLPVRTLDALHLASIHFLRTRDPTLDLATYDGRMRDVAERMEIPLHEL